ncbi:uncharacterized protein LOC132545765 [Ylistrum balloti]|uniref:uncharacterized protein LOC132545765 n=1 Tax=Ylistrum balloti TaxID=509963 RepID=UPI0029059E70|nr:uncharacterized protein LOC132545765 [Ylistrum balloti]
MAYTKDDRIAFGDQTRLDPFDVIVNDLISDLDGDDLTFDEIINLSRTSLGGLSKNNIQNATHYFQILKNNFGEEDMLDFLINVTDFQNWHRDLGRNRVADMLKKYKTKFVEHKRRCMQMDIFDVNFVGRENQIKDFIESTVPGKKSSSAVSISGAGGIGKTAIGNEICRRLWSSKKHWQVIKIDLREKDSMGDLLKDIVLELQLKDDGMSSDDLLNSLKDTKDSKMQANILDHLSKITRRTIVMLDNVDDIIHKNENQFLQFVQKILEKLRDTCKVRIIVTNRVNLRDIFERTMPHMRDLIRNLEVGPLDRHPAKELIRKCTPKDLVSEAECDSLVTLTDGIPLALRTICSILRSCCRQVKPVEIINHLRKNRVINMDRMEKCLQESYDRLDENMKNILMQLTLFKTSSFDIDAADAVLKEDNAPYSPVLNTKMNLFHLKSRHLIEIHDMTVQTEGNLERNTTQERPPGLGDSDRNILYSLHPRMFEFLIQRKSEFSNVMEPARIRFVEYMENIIGIIGKEQENSYYSVGSYMREYNVHVQSYFDMIQEITDDYDTGRSNIQASNRILAIGRRTLTQNRQLRWLEWVTHKAEQNNEIDKLFFFRGYMIQLLTEMDDTTRISDIIHVTEEKLDEANSRSDTAIKVALGNYYYRKAIYFRKIERRHDILKSLDRAKKYLEDKELQQVMERNENLNMILANVFNDLGCYFYLYDNDKCRKYHEEAIERASLWRRFTEEEHPDVDRFRNNRAVCLLKEILDNTSKDSSRDQYINETLEHFDRAIAEGRRRGTDNTDDHAEALRNRSILYLQLKRYEEAKADAKKSLEVREKILKEPHVYLTLSYSLIARILFNWGDQRIRDDKIAEGYSLLQQSVTYYDKTMEKMMEGGMPTDHDEYPDIKRFHLLAVKRTDANRKSRLQQEYSRFECIPSTIVSNCSVSSEDSDSLLDSAEESYSSDDLTNEKETDSSQYSSDSKKNKELQVDVRKTIDDTQHFPTPVYRNKERYERQESGYVSGASVRSRRLSRQESFEILERPRLTSNTSGSSEDVFSRKPSSLEMSMEEIMASTSKRRSRIHQVDKHQGKRLSRDSSDRGTLHVTGRKKDNTPEDHSREGDSEPVVKVRKKDRCQRETDVCNSDSDS